MSLSDEERARLRKQVERALELPHGPFLTEEEASAVLAPLEAYDRVLDALDRAERAINAARAILPWLDSLPVKHPDQAEARERLRKALEEYGGAK